MWAQCFIMTAAFLCHVPYAVCLDNGLARTPPMGWMTWERFRCTAGVSGTGPSCAEDPSNCISERLVMQHADILAMPEWHSLGYSYVNIDDCWENWNRSADGKLQPNSSRFPHGMRALADYVHAKGLRLGTYNDMGTATCGKYPGECTDQICTLPGYMGTDATTYAGWGIDSLKMDGCNSVHSHAILDPAYEFMGVSLNKTGRAILYSCSWPDYIRTDGKNNTVDYTVIADHCNMWRMYNDIQDSWDSVTGIVDWVGDNGGNPTSKGNGMLAAAGPGNWNDPDMLIIGNFALSVDQAKAQMALWCIMAAPLMMGNDLRNLAPEMKAILTAKEVIAVDQDSLGKQGWRVFQDKSFCGAHDIWMKPLANQDIAVVLWNRGVCGTHSLLTVQWAMLGINPNRTMIVRDLFLKKDLGEHTTNFTSFVNIDGVLMVRIRAKHTVAMKSDDSPSPQTILPPLRIMPFGDSITVFGCSENAYISAADHPIFGALNETSGQNDQGTGYPYPDGTYFIQAPGGYRGYLGKRLAGDIGGSTGPKKGAPAWSFVGSQFECGHHEGYAGETVAWLANRTTAIMTNGQPDIILFMAGTNDFFWKVDDPHHGVRSAPALVVRLRRLLDLTFAVVPEVTFLISTITHINEARCKYYNTAHWHPGNCPDDMQSNIIAYNQMLPQVVSEYRAKGFDIALHDINAEANFVDADYWIWCASLHFFV